ncbi:helix-turn-helix transcriptional regulator [Hymenobacter sp. BT507]|uniref:Helix-turn-helix transcriptional regulator n=1 Tax=Hymenobacter citatus TaxID=2763506 RepID=A0ABR7MGV1_9BACT|nr:helix-turn-helix transcriptional regulator [Hymenobacter citatus]
MIERIRQILATRALSPTQFADTIGIGRPVVSHILSGRNKPSLEVMQKIMDAFPDLALPWLLKGEGPMLVSALTETPSGATQAISTSVVSSNKKRQHGTSPTSSELSSEAIKPKKGAVNHSHRQIGSAEREESAVVEQETATPESPMPIAQASQVAAALPLALAATPTDKAIRRIIIFYQDGTFTDYQPEK